MRTPPSPRPSLCDSAEPTHGTPGRRQQTPVDRPPWGTFPTCRPTMESCPTNSLSSFSGCHRRIRGACPATPSDAIANSSVLRSNKRIAPVAAQARRLLVPMLRLPPTNPARLRRSPSMALLSRRRIAIRRAPTTHLSPRPDRPDRPKREKSRTTPRRPQNRLAARRKPCMLHELSPARPGLVSARPRHLEAPQSGESHALHPPGGLPASLTILVWSSGRRRRCETIRAADRGLSAQTPLALQNPKVAS